MRGCSCVHLQQTSEFTRKGGQSGRTANGRMGERGSTDWPGADPLHRGVLLLSSGRFLSFRNDLHPNPVVGKIFAAFKANDVSSRFGWNTLAVPIRLGCDWKAVVAVETAKQCVDNLGEHGRLPSTDQLRFRNTGCGFLPMLGIFKDRSRFPRLALVY